METNKSKNSGKSKESSTSQNYNYESEEQEIQDYENDDFNFLKDFEENVNKQNNISKSRRKHIEENLNDLEENINKQSSILDKNTKNFIRKLNRANEKLIRRRKSDMTNKSVFNYQNFKLTSENFPRWYRALKRHLTALDLIDYIKKDLDITEMDDDELKEDCATQTIIESSLDSTTAELIEGCETTYEMIIR